MPEVTELLSTRAETGMQVCLLPKVMFLTTLPVGDLIRPDFLQRKKRYFFAVSIYQ